MSDELPEVERLRTRLMSAFVASGWAGSLVNRDQFSSQGNYERAVNAHAMYLSDVVLDVLGAAAEVPDAAASDGGSRSVLEGDE